MIEKELVILKETEAEARAILKKAEEEGLEIVSKAKQEAERRHAAIIQQAHKEGETYLKGVMTQMEATKKAGLLDLEEKIRQTRALGESRIEYAVNRILERMWENGHRSDE